MAGHAGGRIMVAAPASGGGKTTFTCGLLRSLQRRGLAVTAGKCGPDFIDPMFHEHVVGVPSLNLDLFLSDEAHITQLIAERSYAADIMVIEGVMGFYDGIGLTDKASSYEVARKTKTPVLLVVDCKGRALSVCAEVLGMWAVRPDAPLAAVVLNRVSPALYPEFKRVIEEECGVSVLGYIPQVPEVSLTSRHLGLVGAHEVAHLSDKINKLADVLDTTLDLEGISKLAASAPALHAAAPVANRVCDHDVTIAVARDDAFCFYYQEALDTLVHMGAKLQEFSPIHDRELPENTSALYLGGGYPELHALALEANESMRNAVARAISSGMPTIAECGGFLYLHKTLEDAEGISRAMAGVFDARAYKTEHLRRFGYVTLKAHGDSLLARAGEEIRAHEFHYWESEDPGQDFIAVKPSNNKTWSCIHATPTLYAGFPHLNLAAYPDVAARFVTAASRYSAR
ncbi:MAG: cobyrinate a,c-diamide synthase [Atopobiaceae bacterium]|jgi:cobyrinic acid a,c-diamide synthase